jgi:predicted RNA binding protein YcfA (HicA-like mRNA interferase family)
MARLPAITGKERAKVAVKLGFAHIRTTGSHMVYAHHDGRWDSFLSFVCRDDHSAFVD